MEGFMDFKLFLDLDGVLCDFEARIHEMFGRGPKEIHPKEMWKTLARTPDFYANLDWMPDGKHLWEEMKQFNPTILTGIPMGNWAPKQKRVWCGRNLGWDVPVITCFARDKFTHGQSGDVLIDDTAKNSVSWNDMGGVFILHTSSTTSIDEFYKLLSTHRNQ